SSLPLAALPREFAKPRSLHLVGRFPLTIFSPRLFRMHSYINDYLLGVRIIGINEPASPGSSFRDLWIIQLFIITRVSDRRRNKKSNWITRSAMQLPFGLQLL